MSIAHEGEFGYRKIHYNEQTFKHDAPGIKFAYNKASNLSFYYELFVIQAWHDRAGVSYREPGKVFGVAWRFVKIYTVAKSVPKEHARVNSCTFLMCR